MNTIHFSNTFEIISWIFVLVGIISFFIILIDCIRHPQKMKIMNLVWTLNSLWGSAFILWMYFSFGRMKPVSTDTGGAPLSDMMDMKSMSGMSDMSMDEMKDMSGMPDMPMNGMEGMSGNMTDKLSTQQIAKSTLHCGSGCTLADIIGSFVFFLFPFTIFGSITIADWTLAYVLALVIGVIFQYTALSSMQIIGNGEKNGGLWLRAFKIDFWSLTSWQVGMYGWMAVVIFGLFGRIPPTRVEFWFMMQIAMLAGFLCSFPVNRILIKSGIKKIM